MLLCVLLWRDTIPFDKEVLDMKESNRDKLLKKIIDSLFKLSDNQIKELKKFIEEEIENANKEQ